MYDPKLHIFIDHHGVQSTTNMELVMGQAKKHPVPVIKQDRPWESQWLAAWGSVFRNPETGLLNMWYEATGFNNTIYIIRTCLAESADGINWTKPNLGCYSFNGSDDTNIVLAAETANRFFTDQENKECAEAWAQAKVKYLGEGTPLHEYVYHYDGTNVVYDHKEEDPGKRYKWIGWMERRDEVDKKLNHNMLTSPDGIHWDMKPEQLMCRVNDGTKVQWDPIGNRWSMTYLKGEKLDTGENIRHFGLTESYDLRNWNVQERPFEFDEEDNYGKKMQGHFILPFPYGDQYVGFASMIATKAGWTQAYLISSRDGRQYDRNFRSEPFLRVGADDEFDADSAEIAIGAPILVGEYLYLYYTGRARRPWAPRGCTGSIGLLKLRRDRFAGFTNGMWFNRNTNNLVSNAGLIITKPVEVTGPNLYINGKTRDTKGDWGIIRAELLDASMKPVPGFGMEECLPFRGDETRARVVWKNGDSVEKLAGQQVSVRFSVNMATLYAYTFC